MPVRESSNELGFTASVAPEPEAPDPVGYFEALPAAFGAGNDVVLGMQYLNQPTFKGDPEFKLEETLKASPFWNTNRREFYGTRSQEEFDHRANELNRERKQMETLHAAGGAGVAALLTAGIVSPTMFIPFVGPARTVGQGARSGAALGGLAGAAQEGIIAAGTRREESLEELGFNVAASAVFSGVLGGGVGYLRGKALARAEKDLIDGPAPYDGKNPLTIPDYELQLYGAGAQINSTPKTKGTSIPGVSNKITDWSPLMQAINQDSNDTFRWMAHQLSDGGLVADDARVVTKMLEDGTEYLEGGKIVAPKGRIENLIKTEADSSLYRAFNSISSNYDEYLLGRQSSNAIDYARAKVGGVLPPQEKLSRSEFRREIGKAMFTGDKSDIPEIQRAIKQIRKDLDRAHDKAVKAGLYDLADNLSDPSYLFRMYNKNIIKQNKPEFVQKLKTHYLGKLEQRFQEKLTSFKKFEQTQLQVIEDFDKPLNEAQDLITDLRLQLNSINETVPTSVRETEAMLKQLRKRAKNIRAKKQTIKTKEELEAIRADMRNLQDNPALQQVREDRRGVRNRLRSLTKAHAVLGKKYGKMIEDIEGIEQRNLNRLERLQKGGARFIKRIDMLSERKLQKELKRLQERFKTAEGVFQRGEGRIATLLAKEPETGDLRKIAKLADISNARELRLLKTKSRVEFVDGKLANRQQLIAEIEEAMKQARIKAEDVQKRQYKRLDRLEAKVKELSPEQLKAMRDSLVGKLANKKTSLQDLMTREGAEYVDVEDGVVDFADHAESVANEVTENILGIEGRTAGVDIIQSERGPALRRLLDIKTEEIFDFVETDIEQVLKSYYRTIVPDTLLKERFGNPNGGDIKQKALEELNLRIEKIWKSDATDKAKQIASDKLYKQYERTSKNIDAMIGRLRGTHGLPSDPTAMSTRMGRVALQLNSTRLMGRVAISSVPDLSRPILKHGLMRTMKHAWVPMITDMKKVKMSARELRLAGVATDIVNQSRTRGMFDTMEVLGTGTKFERGLEFTSSKLGLFNGLDAWNTGMKTLAGATSIGRFTEELGVLMKGGTAKEVKQATEFLAAHSIDQSGAEMIWKNLMSETGGDDVGGVRLPNTEAWDAEAQALFRQALAGDVDNTIVTPGIERPLISDSSLPGRMAFQFKSFALSSSLKATGAAVQQRDMAVFNGMMFSLALGALSWYISAQIAGGSQKAKMLNATMEDWMDEAINRSGLLGIIAEAQRLASHVPAVNDYTQFGEGRLSRGSGAEVFELLGGPTAGLAKNAYNVMTGNKPARNARLMMPYQNLIGVSKIFDAVEAAASNK